MHFAGRANGRVAVYRRKSQCLHVEQDDSAKVTTGTSDEVRFMVNDDQTLCIVSSLTFLVPQQNM